MNDRLVSLMDAEQLSSSKFADIIGVQRSSVSHVLSGRNKPSFVFLQKTLQAFPMINADWLILGKGSMYKGDENISVGNLFDQPPKVIEKQSDTADLTAYDNEISAVNTQDLTSREAHISENPDEGKEKIPSEKEIIKDEMEEKQQISEPEKVVEKIVVFYSDNTFHSYSRSE